MNCKLEASQHPSIPALSSTSSMTFSDGSLLRFHDEVIGLVPVGQQIRGLVIINADVVVGECAREEVVDFPSDVQDISHPETHAAG